MTRTIYYDPFGRRRWPPSSWWRAVALGDLGYRVRKPLVAIGRVIGQLQGAKAMLVERQKFETAAALVKAIRELQAERDHQLVPEREAR